MSANHERPGCGEEKTDGTCTTGCCGRSVRRRATKGEVTAPTTPSCVPAWKTKAVLEEGARDPNAAPFGGSWTEEVRLDATAPGTATPSP
jgi:hypothetical protein